MEIKSLNDTALQTLHLIYDGAWHHGSKIAETLHVSRTAIWKQINSLKLFGYKIESDRVKGYQLTWPKTPLLKVCVLQKLKELNCRTLLNVDVFASISSTNDYLKKQVSIHNQVLVCLAEQQLLGRGRFNRQWCSPFGENIYLSIKKQLTIPFASLSGFSLCISLAIINALVAYGFSKRLFQIKWPNDLLIDGKKLAGVLIELSGEAGSDVEATIGIGLNVNMLDADIDKAWTSLAKHQEHPIDRNHLVAYLIESVLKAIHQFESNGFISFQSLWQRYDQLLGQKVILSFHQSTIEGLYQGIDNEGNMLLKHNDATIKSYSAGEVSFQRSQ